MTDILFINSAKDLALNQETNGTMLLATKLLSDGFEAQILRCRQIDGYHKDYPTFIRNAVDRILQLHPKCLCLYTLWPYFHMMLRIAQEIRRRDSSIYTVLGGPQSSATAQAVMEAMPFIDFVCTGEGEHTVIPFFRALLRGEGCLDDVPGLYHRRDGQILFNDIHIPLCDLDDLPFWDERLYAGAYREDPQQLASPIYYMPIDAGRGCPYNCSFCCTSYFWRRTYRLKSPERIVRDIRHFQDNFGIHSFWFAHDAFTTRKDLVTQVCDRIIEDGLNINWKCSSRVDCITEELILKMKQAGMTEIELGIETGSQRMQKLTHKNLDLDKARRMIKFMVDQNLVVSLFFMLGFPDETEEDLRQTLELLFTCLDMGVEEVGMFFCRFTPATEITVRHMDKLILDPKIKVLSRAIFGYQEELPMIAANKALFTYFYHLPTPLRDEFQYMLYLIHLYQQFPKNARLLRKLYNGDDLQLYRDLIRNNPCFQEDIRTIQKNVEEHPLELLCNTVRDLPLGPLVGARLKLERDVERILRSEEDITIHDVYDLNFIDYQLKRPLESCTPGKTELLLQKVNGVTDIKVLKLF